MSIMQCFRKLINTFPKNNSEKPIATLTPVDMTPLITRLIITLETQATKQKRNQPAKVNDSNKCIKKS